MLNHKTALFLSYPYNCPPPSVTMSGVLSTEEIARRIEDYASSTGNKREAAIYDEWIGIEDFLKDVTSYDEDAWLDASRQLLDAKTLEQKNAALERARAVKSDSTYD